MRAEQMTMENEGLAARIRKDWMAARMASRAKEAAVLSTLVGECQTKEKQFSPARPLRDEEVIAVAKKFLKGVDETISLLQGKPGLESRKEDALQERTVLLRYLPTLLDEAGLETFVRERIAEGASNVGAIMKALAERHAGAYDGKAASAIAARCLKA